jgi:hypothetical protein
LVGTARCAVRPLSDKRDNYRRTPQRGVPTNVIGAKLARKNAMPVFSGVNLIGGLLFGSIGFVAFIYGKRMHVWKPMFLGIALMAYPYFVTDDLTLFVIGVAGTAALFLFRD